MSHVGDPLERPGGKAALRHLIRQRLADRPEVLIAAPLAAAAIQSGRPPWQIGFKGTLQTLSHFLPLLLTRAATEAWCQGLLKAVATHVVGDRPDRFEPRVIKRRPKPYKRIREPRENYRTRMLHGR